MKNKQKDVHVAECRLASVLLLPYDRSYLHSNSYEHAEMNKYSKLKGFTLVSVLTSRLLHCFATSLLDTPLCMLLQISLVVEDFVLKWHISYAVS